MRVLVVTNAWPTETEPWLGCYIRDQVDDVRALGVEIDVLAFDGRERELEYARAVFEARRRLKRNDYAVVHAHYGLTGAVAVLAGAGRGRALVTTFHGSDTGFIPWQLRVSKWASRHGRAIVVDADAIARLGVRHADVIPCGVDVDRFTPGDRGAARRNLGWPLDRRIALFASNPGNRVKRYPLFADAVAIAGAADARWIARTIEGLGRDEVAAAMQASDVMVLTSYAEGSPITVREALASGTPVISVDVGDVSRVLRDLEACKVVPAVPPVIADAILALPGDSTKRYALRARAEQYSRQRVAERVRAVYEGVESRGCSAAQGSRG